MNGSAFIITNWLYGRYCNWLNKKNGFNRKFFWFNGDARQKERKEAKYEKPNLFQICFYEF